jgi:hypothetical protein
MGDVRGGAGAVTGTVLVDTNVFTARLRERSPLATRYAKHLFGQRIALAPHTVAEARYEALNANWGPARVLSPPAAPPATCPEREPARPADRECRELHESSPYRLP